MLKTNDIMTLDTICNEFVANLRAGDDSTPVIKLKPPYNIMTELDEISTGRGERTQTFDLTVPNRARYQLRHTPSVLQGYYTRYPRGCLVVINISASSKDSAV